jgi:hypothetical protein
MADFKLPMKMGAFDDVQLGILDLRINKLILENSAQNVKYS